MKTKTAETILQGNSASVAPVKQRITSVDFLKGLIMVIMAIDHTREYFHSAAYFYDPNDLDKTSTAIFMTRWLTHFCAPAFSFLAGVSVMLSSHGKTLGQLSGHLLKRGLWLILMEFTIITFGWCFDPQFRFISLATIWSLGVSMIVLSGLIYLPRKAILAFGLTLIFGHNLFDNVHFGGNNVWLFLHEGTVYNIGAHHKLEVLYPLIPWMGVMAAGYWFGGLYNSTVNQLYRKKLLTTIGVAALLLFIILRVLNLYGDHYTWTTLNTATKTVLSFIRVEKYPPSLQYLLLTLGILLLMLAWSETLKGRIVSIFTVYGKVPFFYYILHIYLLHLLALTASQLTFKGWGKMIFTSWVNDDHTMQGFGFGLGTVYLIWLAIVVALYPLCKWFGGYKLKHKEKRWLSYL